MPNDNRQYGSCDVLMGTRASDRTYSRLRAEIIECVLAPGTVLKEVDLAERFGISRTPVREALVRLAAEGLTAAAPGRAAVVTEVSPTSAEELFELREALEGKVAALAAQRGDRSPFLELKEKFIEELGEERDGDTRRSQHYALASELDLALAIAAGNSYLSNALAGLRTHVARLTRLVREDFIRLREASLERLAITGAIADGDPTLAEAATTVHLRNSLNTFRQIPILHTHDQRKANHG